MTFAPFLAPERDQSFKRGRPKTATTYYSLPGVAIESSGGGFAVTAGQDYYSPIFVETPIVVDQLAMQVATLSAGNARIGLYRADTDWQPIGGPLADSGNIDTGTTGVKTYAPSPALYLSRGRYLTVINCSATPTLGGVNGWPTGAATIRTTSLDSMVNQWRVTRAFAAFPTPGTAWDTTTNGSQQTHLVVLRISTP